MKIYLILIFISIHFAPGAQVGLLKNEIIMYSFKANGDKNLILARDTSNLYLMCRFGSDNFVEFETKSKSVESWKCFTYSYWMRGGGQENSGIDLNFIAFNIGQLKYIIYDTYSAEGESHKCGVLIINQHTGEETEIKGVVNSVCGSLIDFRWNELVTQGEELY